ncbi:MAG TPA: DUF6573 family protein [Tepidisphaeraceae bacterium]|nr:DUF6573 family protein [Tepidisphaeraceae bacterium]
MSSDSSPFEDVPVAFRYTRAQAIADGVLVDLTEWAREVGFVFPVACTAAVWDRYVVPADGLRAGHGQSERGRGHDVVWLLACHLRALAPGAVVPRVEFDMIFLMPPGRHVTVRLAAGCGPGDAGEPVVTIMLPEED